MDKETTSSVDQPETEAGAALRDYVDRLNRLPKGSETVLLTEDDSQILAMVAGMLSSQGYNVIEASDGDEALRLTGGPDDRRINLLSTDIAMPRMNCKELATEVRIGRTGVKVIFTPGNVE